MNLLGGSKSYTTNRTGIYSLWSEWRSSVSLSGEGKAPFSWACLLASTGWLIFVSPTLGLAQESSDDCVWVSPERRRDLRHAVRYLERMGRRLCGDDAEEVRRVVRARAAGVELVGVDPIVCPEDSRLLHDRKSLDMTMVAARNALEAGNRELARNELSFVGDALACLAFAADPDMLIDLAILEALADFRAFEQFAGLDLQPDSLLLEERDVVEHLVTAFGVEPSLEIVDEAMVEHHLGSLEARDHFIHLAMEAHTRVTGMDGGKLNVVLDEGDWQLLLDGKPLDGQVDIAPGRRLLQWRDQNEQIHSALIRVAPSQEFGLFGHSAMEQALADGPTGEPLYMSGARRILLDRGSVYIVDYRPGERLPFAWYWNDRLGIPETVLSPAAYRLLQKEVRAQRDRSMSTRDRVRVGLAFAPALIAGGPADLPTVDRSSLILSLLLQVELRLQYPVSLAFDVGARADVNRFVRAVDFQRHICELEGLASCINVPLTPQARVGLVFTPGANRRQPSLGPYVHLAVDRLPGGESGPKRPLMVLGAGVRVGVDFLRDENRKRYTRLGMMIGFVADKRREPNNYPKSVFDPDEDETGRYRDVVQFRIELLVGGGSRSGGLGKR